MDMSSDYQDFLIFGADGSLTHVFSDGTGFAVDRGTYYYRPATTFLEFSALDAKSNERKLYYYSKEGTITACTKDGKTKYSLQKDIIRQNNSIYNHFYRSNSIMLNPISMSKLEADFSRNIIRSQDVSGTLIYLGIIRETDAKRFPCPPDFELPDDAPIQCGLIADSDGEKYYFQYGDIVEITSRDTVLKYTP